MIPLVGLGLDGPSFTPRDLSLARLGEPVWGPLALMRDLELRLGIPPSAGSASSRLLSYQARIEAVASTDPFYARSFIVDPIGTTSTLLGWRDTLVEAGWSGEAVPDGGDRLAALAAVEQAGSEPALPGGADRLVRIETELLASRSSPYERLSIAESPEVWSRRWRTIFDRLEALGTLVDVVEPALPGASAGSDLGLLQRLLREDRTLASSGLDERVQGDGSMTVFRGETPAELAELLAAALAGEQGSGGDSGAYTLVVRGAGAPALDAALLRHGLGAQGHRGASPWRPATQILPLALELAFEPLDPHRLLELLTLPVGPFRGRLGATLAHAVVRQPGVLGQEWMRRRQAAAESLREERERRARDDGKSDADAKKVAEAWAAARMQRVTDWIESPRAGGGEISRERLLEIATRVRKWLSSRLTDAGEAVVYRAAVSQAKDFVEAVAGGPSLVGREELRHLFDTVARSSEGHELVAEAAGRLAHVSHPSAVLSPASTVVFWSFVSGSERRPAVVPWNAAERRALAAADVDLPDPVRLLAEEARSWRRAVLAAEARVIFVVPRAHMGSGTAPHPLWDEIVARLSLAEDERSIDRISKDASAILRDGHARVLVTPIPALPLPRTEDAWRLSADALAGEDDRASHATAIESLVRCPLAWTFAHRARLRSGAVAKVAAGPLLDGSLGHRLVEELFRAGAFDLDETAFVARVAAILEDLVRKEGATLLLEGAAFEHAQLCDQLRRAMRGLHRYLDRAGFRIAGVEEDVTMGSAAGSPHGRLDVRLVDQRGEDAILDLKWGASSYRKLIEGGGAIQLALYALALAAGKGLRDAPPAAYYSLAQAKVVTADPRMKMGMETIDGPSLVETWARVDRTRAAVRAAFSRGEVPVADTRRGLSLLEQLGVPEADREGHHADVGGAPCQHCDHATLCGRAWKDLG